MIFYYSATGNSRYVASCIAEKLQEKAEDLLNFNPDNYSQDGDERMGFVFPIYCWGIPPVVKRFVDKIAPRIPNGNYLWAACSCGDEAGIAMRIFSDIIKKGRGRKPDALFSIIMPNTYVLLPGFDVDKPPVEQKKLKEAPARINHIAECILGNARDTYSVHEGSLPALRTRLLYPLFEKWGVSPRLWHAEADCIGCGKCSKICPARNITMQSKRPEWGENCYSCCACFHVCPVKAINYGKITLHKSQYLNPCALTPVCPGDGA